ncbi:MAG: hypothetical protein HY856_06915 [Burkholderiales bacterium]|jgi:hypothetical protein|nr:hypothetical protein [Burkholderiales bacterium]
MRRLPATFYVVVALLSTAMTLVQPAEADALNASSPAVADELVGPLVSQLLEEEGGAADAAIGQ